MIFDKLFEIKNTDGTLSILNTDMHSHLIPGIDDGSPDLDTSLECMREMYRLGFRKICLTPHFQSVKFQNDEDDVLERVEKLRSELVRNDIGIELAAGGEYLVDSGFQKRVSENKFLTINGKYLLIEFSFSQAILGLHELVFELQKLGHEVILAHPERYIYFHHHPKLPQTLKDAGVYFQANINSFSGFYGKSTQKTAYQYIKNGWIDFLGTDMHNWYYMKWLQETCHSRKFQNMLRKNTFENNKI